MYSISKLPKCSEMLEALRLLADRKDMQESKAQWNGSAIDAQLCGHEKDGGGED